MATKVPLLLAGLLVLGGCLAPPSQSQRVTDSARDIHTLPTGAH